MRFSISTAACIIVLLASVGCAQPSGVDYDAVMNGPDSYDAPSALTGGTLMTHPAYGFSFRVPEKAVVRFEDRGIFIAGYGHFAIVEDPDRFDQSIVGITERTDARILFREKTDEYELVFFQSVGGCSYKQMIMKMGDWSVVSSSLCDNEPMEKWTQLVAIARSFSKPADTEIVVTPFDSCGPTDSYEKEEWYPAFKRAVKSLGFVAEGDEPGFAEGCMALDRTLFIAQWNGPWCLGRVVRYDIGHARLSIAGTQGKEAASDPDCGKTMGGFGERSGDSIPVSATIDTDNCDSSFTGTYDVARNWLTWNPPQMKCEIPYY